MVIVVKTEEIGSSCSPYPVFWREIQIYSILLTLVRDNVCSAGYSLSHAHFTLSFIASRTADHQSLSSDWLTQPGLGGARARSMEMRPDRGVVSIATPRHAVGSFTFYPREGARHPWWAYFRGELIGGGCLGWSYVVVPSGW